jgi:hypothetical protein
LQIYEFVAEKVIRTPAPRSAFRLDLAQGEIVIFCFCVVRESPPLE